jgi:hypothetical protein
MIPLNDLKNMFANMRSNTKWDVDGALLWGYFFVDFDVAKLRTAARRLADEGYRVVQIYETDDRRAHVLHVERVERHTPETLNARNHEFEELAAVLGLASYDGMDVGPAPVSCMN